MSDIFAGHRSHVDRAAKAYAARQEAARLGHWGCGCPACVRASHESECCWYQARVIVGQGHAGGT